MTDYVMTIGGKRVTSSLRFDVLNRATEEVVASAPECSEDQLDLAVAAALRAQLAWREKVALRREALARCAKVLRAHVEPLARLPTSE